MRSIDVWCTHEPAEIFFRVHRAVHDPTTLPEGIEFSRDTSQNEWMCLPSGGPELIQLVLQVLPGQQGSVRVFRDPVSQDDVLGVRVWDVASWSYAFPFVIHVLKNWVGWRPLASTDQLFTPVLVRDDCHEDAVDWLQGHINAL